MDDTPSDNLDDDTKPFRGLNKIRKESEKMNPRTRKQPDSIKKRICDQKRISNFLSEFLGPYMLVGYSLNEEEVCILHSNSPLEINEVDETSYSFLIKVFLDLNGPEEDNDSDESPFDSEKVSTWILKLNEK